ncbi:uncharacterized protein B0H64DRAFT_135261 [Chaetomium fimeti]|uniref:Uncharacterized protein n=1 Tax=Chaetomium fimeti TaxID=1854472 RepID=A0AAE0HK58_9PEZI|nr:hypothetical protein B0H64DRAFT_135261 [Chaetomium fimeti]
MYICRGPRPVTQRTERGAYILPPPFAKMRRAVEGGERGRLNISALVCLPLGCLVSVLLCLSRFHEGDMMMGTWPGRQSAIPPPQLFYGPDSDDILFRVSNLRRETRTRLPTPDRPGLSQYSPARRQSGNRAHAMPPPGRPVSQHHRPGQRSITRCIYINTVHSCMCISFTVRDLPSHNHDRA